LANFAAISFILGEDISWSIRSWLPIMRLEYSYGSVVSWGSLSGVVVFIMDF